MIRAKTLSAILLSGAVLAGCVSPGEMGGDRAQIAPRPTGVDGQWASVGGPLAYTASFRGGAFSSTETATGASLAQGTYRNLGQGQIAISSRSATSGQESSVNCNQMSADRLACVTSGGNRFELTRQV
jgi:hypothetical protein